MRRELFLRELVEAGAAAQRRERNDGLTEAEGRVMDHLTSAVQAMAELDSQHPEEWDEFIRGIHLCQDLLAVRVCRRSYPDGWPTITES